MTTALPSSRRTRSKRSFPAGLRAVAWGLHFVVVLLAIFSLCSNRFDLWIDLRLLPIFAQQVLKILWAATVLLVPFCTGPRLSGLRKPQWLNQGFAPGWGTIFLLPTLAVIVCLLVNIGYWLELLQKQLVPRDVPTPLIMALLLMGWAFCTRVWIRVSSRLPAASPATRATQLKALLFAIPSVFLAGLLLFVHLYAHPPKAAVDLAVVLGNRVMSDDTASPELRDRTLAAVDLYRRGLVKHLLLSGAVEGPAYKGDHQHNEAAAMRRVCLDEGLPEAALSLDPIGVNTRATACNTELFMKTRGYHSVVACSSDYHLLRTALSFREFGISAYTVPSRPQVWICASLYNDLRELAGIVVYEFVPSYRPPKAMLMHLTHPRVVVHKSANTLELFDGDTLMKTYPCITGGNPGDKEKEGDRRTPIGRFHIVFKNPMSKFHLSLGLDYPNQEDADRGLRQGLITKQQHDQILAALKTDLSLPENQQKLWYTPLGGEIFLHGHAEGRTGTAGCVALSNPDIEELYALLPVGTPVEIQP